MQPLADVLPANTKALIAVLDREYPAVTIDAYKLHDEQYRNKLAYAQAQRDLVDRLITLQKRKEQE